MKEEEQTARAWLGHQGYDAPTYEPEGPSTAPDFGLPGDIAVEVTRLSQVVEHGKCAERIDGASHAIRRVIEKTLDEFAVVTDGPTWWIDISFRRPLPPTKNTRVELRRALHAIDDSPHAAATQELAAFPPLAITALRRSDTDGPRLKLLPTSDLDQGGFDVGNVLVAIRTAVCSKRPQITGLPPKYNKRWLVLVDHLDVDLDAADRAEVASVCTRPRWLDRLVVVDRRDPRTFYEL